MKQNKLCADTPPQPITSTPIDDGVLNPACLDKSTLEILFTPLCCFFWYRFIKQRLHWTLPKLSTPQQCDKWSDLMPLMTWELWLARDIVNDNPLPWQKPTIKLTPGRVAQAMPGILVHISTPASSPKVRGKSPGWKKGKPRKRRIRYPIVKKTTSKPPKKTEQSAS